MTACLAVAHTIFSTATASPPSPHRISDTLPDNYFPLWLDPPSPSSKSTANWYDLLNTSAGRSFTTTGNRNISVNMGQGKGTIHLYANPAFQQKMDDAIRNQPGNTHDAARDSTGTVDECGWPDQPAATAPNTSQYFRQKEPMLEDFSNGLDPKTFVVGLQKGCCDVDKYSKNMYHKNINVVEDLVNGVKKSVIELTAYAKDNVDLCPGPKCRKDVMSSGTLASAGLFASGRYEVIAKVPAVSGLVWAIWTFHYEAHLPNDCAAYTCWCDRMPNANIMLQDACEFRYDGSGKPCKYQTVCDHNKDGWNPKVDPPKGCLRPSECAIRHKDTPDPQFLGNNTFGGWTTMTNHEIDIEIPANCAGTANICNTTVPNVPGAKSCIGDYSTANLNNYLPMAPALSLFGIKMLT